MVSGFEFHRQQKQIWMVFFIMMEKLKKTIHEFMYLIFIYLFILKKKEGLVELENLLQSYGLNETYLRFSQFVQLSGLSWTVVPIQNENFSYSKLNR